jgi:hypothetical protein
VKDVPRLEEGQQPQIPKFDCTRLYLRP